MAEAAVQFVSSPQTGFVPDAFIGENIMFLKLVQSYLEEEDEDGYFLFLDMEKAFDRCSWDFLLKALEKVGFDDDFISYIKLAYSQDYAPKRQPHLIATSAVHSVPLVLEASVGAWVCHVRGVLGL